jgi:hypothetical protein
MSANKVICIDFDGVISSYTSWKGRYIYGKPIKGAAQYTTLLKDHGWTIIIHTTRLENEHIEIYLNENGIKYDYINHNPNQPMPSNMGKPYANIYLDDRGLNFNGDWEETFDKILEFKTYYGKK